MKKRLLVGIVGFLWLFLLCARLPQTPSVRPTVARIELCTRHGQKVRYYTVTDQETMSKILCCLRASNNHILADKIPEKRPAHIYAIRVCLTNGKCHIYHQLGEEFFRRDAGPWVEIPKGCRQKLKMLEKQLLTGRNFT